MPEFASHKHPPFTRMPAMNTVDYFTWHGATELARRIRAAWAAVGLDVSPHIVRDDRVQGGRGPTYVIRLPELINGLLVKKESM